MNSLESAYWDKQASLTVDVKKKVVLLDNLNKRLVQTKKLMDINFYNRSILEIGIGSGVIAGVLKSIYHNKINYHATDVSRIFVEFCSEKYGIPVCHTDVTRLPYQDNIFDYIFAFDSLEHVRPNDRNLGYNEISRVMKKKACIILNIPMSHSLHDKTFDHSFNYLDFMELLRVTNSLLSSYQVYTVTYFSKHIPTQYAWAIGERFNDV